MGLKGKFFNTSTIYIEQTFKGFESIHFFSNLTLSTFFSNDSFWTYRTITASNTSGHLHPLVLALIVVIAVYSRDIGYVIFAALIVFFFLSW